jgi:hypothetical protein
VAASGSHLAARCRRAVGSDSEILEPASQAEAPAATIRKRSNRPAQPMRPKARTAHIPPPTTSSSPDASRLPLGLNASTVIDLAVIVILATTTPVLTSCSAMQPDPLQEQAAELFADDLAADRVPSVRTIRAQLHVGQPRAQRLRDYLATGAARRVESPAA